MKNKPHKTINGITFFPVPEFSDAEIAFGASDRRFFNRRDLPHIPAKYEDMANQLFFKGGDLPQLHNSVDRGKAVRALRAWLSSWNPAHEAKVATVGYALWLWTTGEGLADEKASA